MTWIPNFDGNNNTSSDIIADGNTITGDNNSSYGYGAGVAITSGSRNTLIGKDAGTSITTGTGNTFVGALSADAVTDALYTTAIGSDALGTVTASLGDVVVGYGAGYTATSSVQNSYLGYKAGFANVTGQKNTLIGYQAGNNILGTGNVCVGNQAGQSETGSNKLYISNSNSNNLITGDFSAATLSLNGTTSITNNTDITGNLEITDTLILPKTTGKGIKVDTTTPTWGFRDILGQITVRGVGANDPTWSAIASSAMSAYNFAVGDECWISFHIPHDYVAGTDVSFHAHWLSDGTDTTNTVKWEFDYMYADGHNQMAFPVGSLTTVSVEQASGGQYYHMVTETADQTISSMEPDGIIYVRIERANNAGTDTTDGIFLLQADVHYQSTNIGTKSKTPDFYT